MEEEIYKQQHDIVNRMEEFITQSSLSSSNAIKSRFEIRRIRLASPLLHQR